ncbi:accessory factor UbiK family protein [Allopusillimonas ginsengisoli]|uniref:accessory factor UbiK family protein n=1 Tax=Allopusillimonas ginsengisoli TaxID=453575 RepID=UPI00101F9488|nr:accessory factor UbiK family protein [Allopusillimonas ginsengisoli]TEA70362.1 accessory factor UbiK family protein [Allopusillimonas ginsengisoli]
MIARNEWIEDFQKNISELIAKSPAADIERNIKAMMAQTFSRMDLVTREEFDVQAEMLERAMTRVTALESRIQALEGRPDTPLQQGTVRS